MKKKRILPFLAAAVTAALLVGCMTESSNQGPKPMAQSSVVATPNPGISAMQISPSPDGEIVAANPVPPTENPVEAHLPERIKGIIQLAHGGVGDEVLMAYVNSSHGPFNLVAEQIIYLRDIGIPEGVLTAMIEHGKVSPETVQTTEVAPANGAAGLLAAPGTAQPPVLPPGAPGYSIVADPGMESLPQFAPIPYADQPGPADYNYFYSSLAPYGSWVQIPEYGYCWQPTVSIVNHAWRPYSDRGRWMFTDSGWYWHSDYTWGWAPFHYGRWGEIPGRGWVWVPDRTWGPAWVTWRYSDAYCGWAPLPPGSRFVEGTSLRFHNRNFGLSFDFGLSYDSYTFVPSGRVWDWEPARHRLGAPEIARIGPRTLVINNIRVNRDRSVVQIGIDAQRIAIANHMEVRRATLRELPENGGGGARPDRVFRKGEETVIYRPQSTPSRAADSLGHGSQALRQDSIAGAKNGQSPSSAPTANSNDTRSNKAFTPGTPLVIRPKNSSTTTASGSEKSEASRAKAAPSTVSGTSGSVAPSSASPQQTARPTRVLKNENPVSASGAEASADSPLVKSADRNSELIPRSPDGRSTPRSIPVPNANPSGSRVPTSPPLPAAASSSTGSTPREAVKPSNNNAGQVRDSAAPRFQVQELPRPQNNNYNSIRRDPSTSSPNGQSAPSNPAANGRTVTSPTVRNTPDRPAPVQPERSQSAPARPASPAPSTAERQPSSGGRSEQSTPSGQSGSAGAQSGSSRPSDSGNR